MSTTNNTTATIVRRVYYADTDAGGVVHHATYVKWFEQARTEFARMHNQTAKTWEQAGVVFVVANIQINYRKPVLLDDEIYISTFVTARHKSGMTFGHEIKRDDVLVCEGTARLVCVDLKTKRPVAIPQQLETT